MGIYQYRDLKKPSGGKRHLNKKRKRRYAMGDLFVPTILGEKEERVMKNCRGNTTKVTLRKARKVVVSDKSSGRAEVAELHRIISTPANREFAKRSIITKGAIIETSKGRAVVTSRPGQQGVINAVLIEEAPKGSKR
ncbi:MAG: 30S ribosomal protein S8e [Caldisphaeraceae archaeon]|nr:30S ribosomal protein S8e [Caldisphaeraceae archaeon]MEB3797303.1 30S ribosomal protein S8e [Caldisphaeraceae archaeon]